MELEHLAIWPIVFRQIARSDLDDDGGAVRGKDNEEAREDLRRPRCSLEEQDLTK